MGERRSKSLTFRKTGDLFMLKLISGESEVERMEIQIGKINE